MSGFQDAPVTQGKSVRHCAKVMLRPGMMMVLGVTSLTASLLDIKPYFHLQIVPHMTKYHQFWRILVHPVLFANSTELLLGELMLYNAGRTIERSFGPRKFSAFVLISTVVSTLLGLAAILLLTPFGIRSIPAGPYGIIFSLIWQQYRSVPVLYAFKLLGIELTNKSHFWLISACLAYAQGPSSCVAAATGLIAGYLYRTDTLLLPSLRHRRLFRPLKSYRIPLSLYNLLARLFEPIIGLGTPPRRSNRVLPGQISNAAREAAAGRATLASLLAGAGATATGAGRPNTGNNITARRNIGAQAGATNTQTTPVTPPNTVQTGSQATASPMAAATATRATGTARAAGAAVGEWVSEMAGRTGGTARGPSEEEIATLTAMFPNLSREVVVSALQRNDNNTARTVEALLQGD